ncbi:MAG: bifunctional riboflavin kinase/FAD synthetase, partial [Planctomycetaceae bacterium]
MNVWHGWDQGVVRGGLVSIGNFDGVHRGHQRMLSTLRERGADLGVPTLAVTFDPHPTELLR